MVLIAGYVSLYGMARSNYLDPAVNTIDPGEDFRRIHSS